LALAVPLSRFTPRVGGGSAFFVRPHSHVMHYFKRQWDESRGDEHDDWGTSVWYFETEPDLSVTRQIEVYASGTVLHYDRQHIEDSYGGLSEKPLVEDDWTRFAITELEFEQAWSSRKPLNR